MANYQEVIESIKYVKSKKTSQKSKLGYNHTQIDENMSNYDVF